MLHQKMCHMKTNNIVTSASLKFLSYILVNIILLLHSNAGTVDKKTENTDTKRRTFTSDSYSNMIDPERRSVIFESNTETLDSITATGNLSGEGLIFDEFTVSDTRVVKEIEVQLKVTQVFPNSNYIFIQSPDGQQFFLSSPYSGSETHTWIVGSTLSSISFSKRGSRLLSSVKSSPIFGSFFAESALSELSVTAAGVWKIFAFNIAPKLSPIGGTELINNTPAISYTILLKVPNKKSKLETRDDFSF